MRETKAVESYDCLPSLNLSQQNQDEEGNVCFYVADGSEDMLKVRW